MRKLKLKGLVVVTTLSAVLLTGCTTHEDLIINNEPSMEQSGSFEPVVPYEQYEPIRKPGEESDFFSPILPNVNNNQNNYEDNYEQPSYNDNGYENNYDQYETPSNQEFTFFSDAKREITEYIESEDFQKLKEKGKYYVTTGIDFIFFDKEINGITFNQMSTEFKIRAMNDVAALDQAVEAYFPGYKESFSSKYQVAAEFVSSKYLDIVDYIKEYLGEENWNALGDMKDKIWGDVSTKTDEAIEDINELYKSWRDK